MIKWPIQLIAFLALAFPAFGDDPVKECVNSISACDSIDQSSCLCSNDNFASILSCVELNNGTVSEPEVFAQVCGSTAALEGISKAHGGGHHGHGGSGGSQSPGRKMKMLSVQNANETRKYAAAMVGFLGLCFLLRAISNIAYKASSKVLMYFDNRPSRWLRKNIMLPATFGQRHSQPHYAGPYTFVMPTRAQSLILVVYFIANFVIYLPNYPIIEPTEGATSKAGQLCRLISNRAGVYATFQFPFLLLFGGRNNFFIWITGWPLDYFNVLHKWIGRGVMVNLFIHGVTYSAYYGYEGGYSTEWSRPVWYWGIIGFLAGVIIFVQSVHYLRALKYELFLIVHILMAVVFTLGAWKHVPHGNQIEFIYAAVAVWCFDRLLRFVRIIWGGINSKATVKLFPDDVIQIDIGYSRWWRPYPGAYVFLHFLRWNRFWQNHPFTITEPPQNVDGKIRIMARTKAGITNHTKNYLLKKPDHTCEMRVWIEGPYGPKHHLQRYNRIMFIAGGIGIPGVYGYADALRKQGDSKHRITLLWVIRDERPLRWFGEQLNYLASDERFDVRVYITQGVGNLTESSETDSVEMVGEGVEKKESISPTPSGPQLDPRVKIEYGLPNVYNEVRSVIKEEDGMSAYMVCGPGGMNDMVRKSVCDHIMDAKNRIDYFEEAFSW